MNPLNGPGSAFFDADLRDVKPPFTDAYVEVIGQREGSGAVPYVAAEVPFYDRGIPGGQESTNRTNFKGLWCAAETYGANRFYVLGCRGRDYSPQITAGVSDPSNDYSNIYIETMTTWGQQENRSDPEVVAGIQANTDHELGHQFWLNRCSDLVCGNQTGLGNHDGRPWWRFTSTGCPNANPCLMDPNGGIVFDETNRFCKEDLLRGDPTCSDAVRPDSAIRTLSDPVP